jgi:CheY-like chemotaxis protein
VVELGADGAIDAIRAIKADAALASTEIVGYCRHTEIDRIRAAKAAGCDRVLTQGELAELLPRILSGEALPRGAASCE